MDSQEFEEDPPDLTLRYKLQVSPEAPEKKGTWETVASFDTVIDAMRGCSACYEGVRIFLEDSGVDDRPVEDFIKHRIYDSDAGAILFGEDEEGRVQFEKGTFPNDSEGSGSEGD